ncbi:hypothetical protein Cgig2_024649 [Carnegiea gigantea]|uniref:Endonuclease/exonuclease/phosphatase domain-containing protein n=1 Tax=Carnegiea gigantea TaxID=171969 RepID=A0A9Q1K7Z6_9CARY|nr:hypothetical protein Cgig2_024649 [Carnegiea gigantea]
MAKGVWSKQPITESVHRALEINQLEAEPHLYRRCSISNCFRSPFSGEIDRLLESENQTISAPISERQTCVETVSQESESLDYVEVNDKIRFPAADIQEEGAFVIPFTSENDRQSAMSRHPILFERRPVIMKKWGPDLELQKEQVQSADIWIRCLDMRNQYRKTKGTTAIWVRKEAPSQPQKESSSSEPRLETQQRLNRQSNTISIPEIVCGDFNNVLYTNERVGGQQASHLEINALKGRMDVCSLVALRQNGCFYTWNKKHVYSRIDQALHAKQDLESIHMQLHALPGDEGC